MADVRSFTEYVANRFENELWEVAEKYLEENQEYLAVNLNRIHQVREIIPSEVKVEHVWVADLLGMENSV